MSFRFCRSLPDPYYKACILCENDNVNNNAPDGWSTVPNNITTNNSIAKFGNNSAQFNSSYINITNAYANISGNNDYTFECWIYPTDSTLSARIISASNSSSNYHAIQIIRNHTTNISNIYFYNSNGTRWTNSFTTNNNISPLNTWLHICQTKKAGVVYNFINGSLLNTASIDNIASSGSAIVDIGRVANGYYFKGYMQSIKFSNIARYTESFTCPTKPY